MKEIILLGSVQAFFFAFFLLGKTKRSFADQLLAATLIVGGLQLSTVILHLEGILDGYPLLYDWNCGLPLLSAFLFYFYVKSLTGKISNPTSQFRKLLVSAFSVYTLYYLILGAYLLLPNSSKSQYDLIVIGTFINITNLSAIGWSIFKSLQILHKHNLLLPNQFSNLDNIHLGWLQKWLLFALGSYTLASGGYVLSFFHKTSIDFSNSINAIYASLGIFTLGYFGMKQGMPIPLSQSSKEKKTSQSTDRTKHRYKNQLLTEQKALELQKKIENCIQTEKPHRTENITISQMAKLVNVPINQLSQYLNDYQKQNFYDFINSQRIEEVKTMIKDPTKTHYTLMGIALECGFSSKTTFNRSFKKYTGTTPSQYIQQTKK
ncbi:MAG: helix-turn-helix domain-containing protein [Marinifilaceae bacterium]